MARAVFLDKDGTLVEDVPYNVDPARIRLVPGAIGALRTMAQAAYTLVVVSNQSGVARGLFDIGALRRVEQRLGDLVAPAGISFAGFYWCPHHPDGRVAPFSVACGCRKPAPGLLRLAADELDLDLPGSWMVGDILNDVEAGRRAGCRTVLVDNGGETEWLMTPMREPDYVVNDLEEAASVICGRSDPAGLRASGPGRRAGFDRPASSHTPEA
jgi:histidinol-phosphate phosphatase family protein